MLRLRIGGLREVGLFRYSLLTVTLELLLDETFKLLRSCGPFLVSDIDSFIRCERNRIDKAAALYANGCHVEALKMETPDWFNFHALAESIRRLMCLLAPASHEAEDTKNSFGCVARFHRLQL